MSNRDARTPAPAGQGEKELLPHVRARLAAMAAFEAALRSLEAACIALEPFHKPVQLVGSNVPIEHAMYVLAKNIHTTIVAGATRLGITKPPQEEPPSEAEAAPSP